MSCCPLRDLAAGLPPGATGAQTWSQGSSLRYSAAELGRTDGRPRPELVTRSFASYRYVRAFAQAAVSDYAALLEGAERARVRTASRTALRAANSRSRAEFDDDEFDVGGFRPRGSARARAW
jgi:hypothetical protein